LENSARLKTVLKVNRFPAIPLSALRNILAHMKQKHFFLHKKMRKPTRNMEVVTLIPVVYIYPKITE